MFYIIRPQPDSSGLILVRNPSGGIAFANRIDAQFVCDRVRGSSSIYEFESDDLAKAFVESAKQAA